jgi:uncharacterized NAD(P)/FAD-binding protein YdhS
MQKRPTVAVIGAGFSGVLTALRLLDAENGPCVRLVERRSQFGQGAAYSTTNPQHLLNVRAANMSAFPEEPLHFLDWLARTHVTDEGHTFVTRACYGDYLQSLLRATAETARAAGRLMLEADEVVALHRHGERWRVELAMGRGFFADAVVLALGNLPPHAPPMLTPEAARSPAYACEPWSLDPQRAPEGGTAVLLGTGLTMVDVALSLSQARPDLKILALSRRGLLPHRHLGAGPTPQPTDKPEGGVTETLRQLRAKVPGAENWRAVIDGLRPHVQAIWRDWPEAERRRFLRHARPWWDIHRHRLAPPVAERIDHLTASGMLRTAAGRISRIEPAGEGLTLHWTARGETAPRRTEAGLVVNCTGPGGDLAGSGDPLLADLARQGLLRADACRLGVDVDPESRLIGGAGDCDHPTLFAVGPITRGAFWEVTAVPDIRVQAGECAHAVIGALNALPQTVGAVG